jgi:concanavalin A-like lectin/glucanase superfamily protein/glycosyl hydrolase family 123
MGQGIIQNGRFLDTEFLQMRRNKRFLLLVIFALSGMIYGAKGKITFKLDFEKGAKPVIAAGNPIGKYMDKNSSLQLTKGVKGKGMLTGTGQHALQFIAQKNIDQRRGTITFWMKMNEGHKWKDKYNKYCTWFGWDAWGMQMLFYKYNKYARPYLYYHSRKTIDGTKVCYFPKSEQLNENQWHFYAFTWGNKVINLYIDGEFISNVILKENIPSEKNQGTFFIGQGWNSDDIASSIIDEFTIYDQALSQYKIFNLYSKESNFLTPQKMLVSSTTQNITVDGVQNADEWQDAAAIPLMIDGKSRSVVPTAAYLYLTYNDKNLYFFMRSPLDKKFFEHAHTKLLHGLFLRERTTRDQDIVNDDSFEITFRRDNSGDIHFMSANTLDIRYEYLYTNAGFPIVLKWNPDWKVKSTFKDGTWLLEGAIPWSDLKGKPNDNTVWEMNFNRIWKKLSKEQDMWAVGALPKAMPKGALLKSFSAGYIKFAGSGNLIARMDNITAFNNSKLDFTLTFNNKSAKARKLAVTLKTPFRPVFETTIEVEAGKTKKLRITKEFQKKPVHLRLSVIDEKSKTVYLQQDTPVASSESFDIALMPFPSQKKVKLRGSFRQLNIPSESSNVKITLLDNSGAVLETKTVKTPLSSFTIPFDFAKRTVSQDYLFKVETRSGDQLISTNKVFYRHLPLPEWFHNNLGISDEVPPPWTPMAFINNNQVSCWGREYYFDNKLFFSRLITQKQEVLAAPARLLLKTSKGSFDLNTLPAKQSKVKSIDTEVSFTRIVKYGKLQISNTTKTEYDGFMWHILKLSSKRPMSIEGLVLELPIADVMAKLLVPHDYSLEATGNIKEWRGSVRPFWVGNAEAGIQFVTEQAYTWQNKSVNDQLQLFWKNGKWILHLSLIGKKTFINKPLTFAFGFQVTPVKRYHPDYRKWRINSWKLLKESKEENIELLRAWTVFWGKTSNSSGEVSYPFPHKTLNPKSFSSVVDGRQTYSFPYYQLHGFWYPSPEFKQFGYEWITSGSFTTPTAPLLRDQRVMTVCQGARTLQDVILYGFDKLQKQANPRGYYFDCSQPRTCSNTEHGCGIKVGGMNLETKNILGTRQLVKRIYTHLKKMRPDGMILYHMSGQVIMPIHGFADLMLDGENFNSILYKNRGYEERLTPDTYLAEYVGRNFGSVVALLTEFHLPASLWKVLKSGGKLSPEQQAFYDEVGRHANYLWGLTLLHDNPIWPGWMPHKETTLKYYDTLKKIDYASGKHKFIPYWRNDYITAKRLKTTYVSLYTAPGEVIVVLMNCQKQAANVSFSLDISKLGLSGEQFSVENINNAEKVQLKNGKLSINGIPPYQYRVIRIK